MAMTAMTAMTKKTGGDCPFCGANEFQAVYRQFNRLVWRDGKRVRQRTGVVTCGNCGARGPWAVDENDPPDLDKLEDTAWALWEKRGARTGARTETGKGMKCG